MFVGGKGLIIMRLDILKLITKNVNQKQLYNFLNVMYELGSVPMEARYVPLFVYR